MKTSKLLLILLFVSNFIFAQEVNYYFEQFNHSYSNLSNPISVNNGEVWDDPDYIIPIGFDFSIFNHTTDSFFFGEGLGGSLLDAELENFIYATGADLADRGYNTNNTSSSPISYKVDGEIGKRILKIEWQNAGFYEDQNGEYYTNIQLWIYEGSDMIEIHYGPSNIEDSFYLWEEDLCALLETDWETETATGYILEELEGEYQFSYQNVDDFFEPNTFTEAPEDGTVFRFYPEYAIGIIEKETANIEIHPNPTSDFLSIKNDEKVEMNYKIISIDGRIISQGKSSKQNMQIDLRSLDAGMYFFQQNTEAKSISFIKN